MGVSVLTIAPIWALFKTGVYLDLDPIFFDFIEYGNTTM